MQILLLFSLALILDYLLGDPRFLPHPVRGIGWLCEHFENIYRENIRSEFVAGLLTFVSVISTVILILITLFSFLHRFAPTLELFIAVYFIYSGIAYRDLSKHSLEVYKALKEKKDLKLARSAVQQIVGRDTSQLDEKGIVRACVETVAENLVDGILSPLFFSIVVVSFFTVSYIEPVSLAAVGIYFYKSINTMDSMFGYKNERYRNFGTTAAKIDDLANFLPARLSGFCLIASAFLLHLDYRQGWEMFKRDRLAHSSPNAGHPEAAVAGILGVQLGGNSTYFGKVVEKPTLGDSSRRIEVEDIVRTNRLMLLSSVLFYGCLIILYLSLEGV